MTKRNLKDRLEGNNLDLSLSELKEVPTKEIAALAKATEIDLSCNQLVTLPEDFCDITRITWLDLSKNNLTELPSNFGNLTNLLHLDLYQNNLAMLPVSFRHLKKLKWLDLKSNSLEHEISEVAGNCLDTRECQLCAKKIVTFMGKVFETLEKERLLKQKQEEEKEAKRLLKQEKAVEKERLRKKEQKEQQRKADRAAKVKQRQQAASSHGEESDGHKDQTAENVSAPQVNGNAKSNAKQNKKAKVAKDQISTKTKGSCLKSLFWCILSVLLVGAVSAGSVVLWYTNGDVSMDRIHKAIPLIHKDALLVWNTSLDRAYPYWVAIQGGSVAVYEYLQKESSGWFELVDSHVTKYCKVTLEFVDAYWNVAWNHIKQLSSRYLGTRSS